MTMRESRRVDHGFIRGDHRTGHFDREKYLRMLALESESNMRARLNGSYRDDNNRYQAQNQGGGFNPWPWLLGAVGLAALSKDTKGQNHGPLGMVGNGLGTVFGLLGNLTGGKDTMLGRLFGGIAHDLQTPTGQHTRTNEPVDLSNPSTPTPQRTEASGVMQLQSGNSTEQINAWASKYSQTYLSGHRNAAPSLDIAADAAAKENPSEEDKKNYVDKFSKLGKDVISMSDKNQDGHLDFNEFKTAYEAGKIPVFNFPQDYYSNPKNGLPKNAEDRIQNVFNCLSNGKGYIDVNDATALNILYDADNKTAEGDGKINLEDYAVWSIGLMNNSDFTQNTLKQVRQNFGLDVSSNSH